MNDRRQFLLKAVGLLGAAAAVLKSKAAAARKLGLSLTKVPSLSKVGGSATITLEGKSLLLVRDKESSVKVLSGNCTHQECPVSYNAGDKKIECSCHGSAFDLTGKVLKGPATKNLKSYPAALSDGKIVLTVE